MQKLIVTQRQEAGSKNGRENARQKRKLVAGGLGLIALATLMGLAVHGPLRAWGQGGGLASGRQTEVPAPPHAELAGRTKARVQTAWGKLPLYFTENRGQVDGRVAYYVQGQTTSLYFTAEGVTFALTGPGAAQPSPKTSDLKGLLRPVALRPTPD